jgi:hypothetical protein
MDLFQREYGEWGPLVMVVDLSDFPVEMVARAAPFIWPYKVHHPDLWHDGRWED